MSIVDRWFMRAAFYKLLSVEPGHGRGVALAGTLHFLLLSTYAELRPVRDALGAQAGVRALPSLYTATFVANLVAVVIMAWLFARYPKRKILPWVFLAFALQLVGLAMLLGAAPPAWQAMTAMAFFVWISFYVVAVLSVFWAFCADVYSLAEARRYFGAIAMGGSAGALVGPLLAGKVAQAGEIWWLLAAGTLQLVVAAAIVGMIVKRRAVEVERDEQANDGSSVAGGAERATTATMPWWRPLARVASDPFLRRIAIFVSLNSATATLLYFLQTDALADLDSNAHRIGWLADVDLWTNLGALLLQGVVSARLIRRIGLGWTLALVPLFSCTCLVVVGVYPSLAVLAVAQVISRSMTHGLLRPAREMLFTGVDPSAKYSSKAAIDLVVFRGSDAAYAWLLRGLAGIVATAGASLATLAWIGVPLAFAWANLGRQIGRMAAGPNRPPARRC